MIQGKLNLLILTLLANQAIHIFAELTVMHWSEDGKEKAMCVSEDDGSALAFIKNYDEGIIFGGEPNIKGFYNKCRYANNLTICKMDHDEECLAQWYRKGWVLTNSMDTPMGPVFDRRWEAFTEYELNIEHNISLSNLNKIVVPFSIRAKSDVNILICKNKYQASLCYWVIISGWSNTRSVIRKCPTGVVIIHQYLQDNSKCTEQVYFNHTALSLFEYQTFVLTWNVMTRNISLYDPDQLIMTYEDTENREDTNIFHEISFLSLPSSFIRYHNYTFLYTRNYTSVLSSSAFPVDRYNRNICLQLLIGHCALCDATVTLIDATTRNRISSVIINSSSNSRSSAHGLPTWQFITIKSLLPPDCKKVKLEVIPRFNTPNSNPLWAIANVRKCVPNPCLRITGSIENKGSWHVPAFTCQKLFYQEQSVINEIVREINMETDTTCDPFEQPVGRIGPNCAIICVKHFRNQSYSQNLTNCRGVTICNKNGCTCPPGFLGPNCARPCDEGFYGYGCNKQCGFCFQNKPCNEVGLCEYSHKLPICKNTQNYIYALPFCQTGVGKPDEPEIIFTNPSTIVATVSIKWKEEYETDKLFYFFYIEMLDGRFVYQSNWKQIFENTTHLIGKFENLEPDTFYKIRCILCIVDPSSQVAGDWKTVKTDCDLLCAPRNFSYSFKCNGAVDVKWLYPRKTCNFNLCYFRITIQEISSNLTSNTSHPSKYEIFENSQTHNTHNYCTKRLYLLPSTLYNISIQTVAVRNETSNAISLDFSTPSSVGLDGEPEILSQTSECKIILRIPKVMNDTRDSMTYIIVTGSSVYEQNAKLPKTLLTHIDEKKIKRVWQIIKRPTNELANDVFIISSNHFANCPLKNGELYEIMIIITESEFSGNRFMFMKEILFHFGEPPPTYFEVWFICIILILSGLSAVFYCYRKSCHAFYLRIINLYYG